MYYLIYKLGNSIRFKIETDETPQEDIFRSLPSSIEIIDFFKSRILHPRDFRSCYLDCVRTYRSTS